MRHAMLALAASAAFIAPAHATTVLSDNFDGENGGASGLNYSGFANWDVIPNITTANGPGTPTVDIVANGDFGIACAGGSGSCVDLDGSTQNGATLISKSSFTFHAGDIITLSALVSGNQRDQTPDGFEMGIRFAALTSLDQLTYTSPVGSAGPTSLAQIIGYTFIPSLSAGEAYGTHTLSFRALNAGSFRARFGTTSDDNVGPVIDNILIDVSAVPEPATWGMMIMGFGFVGGALRRRRASVRLSYAN